MGEHSRSLYSIRSRETNLSWALDEIYVRVLTNEHRRFICFGRFSLFS